MDDRNVDWRHEQRRFEAEMLGLVRSMAIQACRRHRIKEWEFFLDDCQYLAWARWHSFAKRGIDPQVVGIWAICDRVVRGKLGGQYFTPHGYGWGHAHDAYAKAKHRPVWDHEHRREPTPAQEAIGNIAVAEWMATQDETTRKVLHMFSFGATMKEVREEMGMTTKQVNAIREKAWHSWQEYNGHK